MATSTSLSSPGIGSGLDVNSIVRGLIAVEQRPIIALQKAEAKLQAKLSAFGQFQALASSLNDALVTLAKPETFKQISSSSSDASAVGVSSTSSAAVGNYSVSVTKLAAAQNLVSPTGQFTASTDTIGTGTLTLRLGDWNNTDPPTLFTEKAGSSDVVITIDEADKSLQGVRDKINAANAGVTATIVTDASGARLSIRSNSTGEVNGFRVNVSETGPAGLARLTYDPQNQPLVTPQLGYAQAASNAEGSINGIAVSSTTSALSDALPGLSFNFSKLTGASPVTVGVSTNTEAVRSAVNRLVSTYNEFSKNLSQQTAYNPGSKQAGLFQGDSTAVGLLSQVRSLLTESSTASGSFSSLSSIGLELQKDGTLKVNTTKLDAAIGNLPELTKVFSDAGSGAASTAGIAKRMSAYTEGLLSSTGTFQSRTKSIETSISNNTKEQNRVNDRLAVTEQRLRAQYTALDVTMSKYNALNKYVTQQFTNNNNNNQ